MVDQQPVTFWGMGPRVETGGRILVPLRGVFEKMDATVAYDETDRTVRATRGDTTMLLTVGSRMARVDDREIALDVPVRVTNGRVLIPLRVISEHLGARVEWDRESQTVAIDTSGLAATSPATEENAASESRSEGSTEMAAPGATNATPPGPNATPGIVQPESPATNAPMAPESVPTAPVVVEPPMEAAPGFDWARWAPWIMAAVLLLGLLAYLAMRGRGGAVIAARNDRGRI